MDRFIDGISIHFNGADNNLKSNMDRFIVKEQNKKRLIWNIFKIQYG